ncbi:MAG: filamentous hemagglutinin N-terminal domain-containing protein [Planctomycetaceae bacterium]|nr:filamentous hemagglutinin N-terminal domain-containing protein [Planctomycetaceae bacterium]
MKTNDAHRVLKNALLGGTLLAISSICGLPLLAQQPTNLGYINGAISNNGGIAVDQNGSTTTIGINGDRSYINWNSFNIGPDQTGSFQFNSGNGVVLNHITGGQDTRIDGNLFSNGNVYVINPNGLTIGQGGVINTKGFVGTTFDLNTSNLQSYIGNDTDELIFTQGQGKAVINHGTIIVQEPGGSLVLMGSHVVNNGELQAPNGNITLYAGTGAIVHNTPGHPLITVNGLNSSLADVNGNVYALAINNTGTIRANAIEITTAGRVLLKGKLLANQSPDGKAGTVHVAGKTIDIENATIAALGDQSSGNGITITGIDVTNIHSSVIATTDADINIEATNGQVNFGISPDADSEHLSTMVNAYGSGDVNVTGKSITLNADKPNAYISVGSNHGMTNVRTTVGNLELYSANGGYAQVGYHFRHDDDRIVNLPYLFKSPNPDALFSGFTDFSTGSDDMKRLADLFVPTGDINVDVKNDLIIFASYDAKLSDTGFVPAAHIGHAYLAGSEVGADITAYSELSPGKLLSRPHQLSGNTNVTVGRDTVITSEGTSIARVGHNVRSFVYLWDSNAGTVRVNEVRGNIGLKAGRDVLITADRGGTSGVGHVGDEFDQHATETQPGIYCADVYSTTAGRHTILTATGNRQPANGGTWHSIAQIGSNIMGEAAVFDPESYKTVMFSLLEANIIALSGANMILTGGNGAVSVIGHENNSRYSPARHYYLGVVLVGYGFNRYKELDPDSLRHAFDPEMLRYYEKLKSYFRGPEEGFLSVDSNSRIGKGYSNPIRNDIDNMVGIFGFRMMRDGVTDAIRLDNGAQIGTGIIDKSLRPGEYVFDEDAPTQFRYNLADYPGDGVFWENLIEYYGYTYADYKAGDDNIFDFLAFCRNTNSPDQKNVNTTRIFYPTIVKKTPLPERPEKPRYPWFPAWFEPCCVPCQPCCVPCKPCCIPCDPCQISCYDPCADPCSAVRTSCESYIPTDDGVEETETEVAPVPTLAPSQP